MSIVSNILYVFLLLLCNLPSVRAIPESSVADHAADVRVYWRAGASQPAPNLRAHASENCLKPGGLVRTGYNAHQCRRTDVSANAALYTVRRKSKILFVVYGVSLSLTFYIIQTLYNTFSKDKRYL